MFVCLFVCLIDFQQSFSHIATISGCGRELIAHFHSAASLKYHAPDALTWYSISHIILTLSWTALALLSWCWAPSERAASTFFLSFWYDPTGDRTRNLPVTKRMRYHWATVPVFKNMFLILWEQMPQTYIATIQSSVWDFTIILQLFYIIACSDRQGKHLFKNVFMYFKHMHTHASRLV